VRLPPQATDDDLRAALANGRLLCALLRRLLPGALLDDATSDNLGRFRAAVERMGVPTFSAYDLERVIELPPPSSSMPRHSICLFPYRLTPAAIHQSNRPSRGSCRPSLPAFLL